MSYSLGNNLDGHIEYATVLLPPDSQKVAKH